MADTNKIATLDGFTDAEIRDEYAERFTVSEQLATFSNDEIESEYEDRFDATKVLRRYDSDTLFEELESRGDLSNKNEVSDEVIDLIAEAARTSPHAARAYELLRDDDCGLPPLSIRQRLIANRMSEVAA